MRSTDHGGRSGGSHGPSRETISARPNDADDRGVDGAAMPGCPVLGPFSFLDHHAMGLFYGEFAYFYRVPAEFDETATAEINGVRNGTASGFGPFEVPTDPKTDEFGESDELGYGEFIGQEFGLPAGTYVGFIYRPDDLDAARETPTTDDFTVTLDDGSGMVITSSPHPINVPALDFPTGVTWGPQSGPSRPSGSLEVTRLDAFTGSTFLPTGEVVFVLNAADWGDDHTFALTQPAHGAVVDIRPEHGRPGNARSDVIHLVYTPDPCYRTDPSVHTDGFTIAVDDGRGGITTASVPVVIVKSATVTSTSGLPYAGTGSFSGRVEAPFERRRGIRPGSGGTVVGEHRVVGDRLLEHESDRLRVGDGRRRRVVHLHEGSGVGSRPGWRDRRFLRDHRLHRVQPLGRGRGAGRRSGDAEPVDRGDRQQRSEFASGRLAANAVCAMPGSAS